MGKTKITTGNVNLDNAFNGGLLNGKIYVISGKRASGKTIFATTIGKSIAKITQPYDTVMYFTQVYEETSIYRHAVNIGNVMYKISKERKRPNLIIIDLAINYTYEDIYNLLSLGCPIIIIPNERIIPPIGKYVYIHIKGNMYNPNNGLLQLNINIGSDMQCYDNYTQVVISTKYHEWANKFDTNIVPSSVMNYVIDKPTDENLFKISINNKWGYVDKQGNEIVPIKYSGIWNFKDGLAIAYINDKWGLVDKQGNEVVPLKYNFIWIYPDGLVSVCLNGRYGYIDKEGNEVIPIKYDWIEHFSEGLASVKLNGKWGYIDKQDNVVIPFKYDWADNFSEGLAKVRLNGNYGYIDKQDNWYNSREEYQAKTLLKGNNIEKIKHIGDMLNKALSMGECCGYITGLSPEEEDELASYMSQNGLGGICGVVHTNSQEQEKEMIDTFKDFFVKN